MSHDLHSLNQSTILEPYCFQYMSKNKMITPYFCSPRRRSVLEPVMRTPTQTGMWNKMLKAKAVPITENANNCKKQMMRQPSNKKLDHYCCSFPVMKANEN